MAEEKRVGEKRVSDTQTIDYFRLYKEMEGLLRAVSIELEEARKALERAYLEKEELRAKIRDLEKRLHELQALAADESTNMSSESLRDRQVDACIDQLRLTASGQEKRAKAEEGKLIAVSIDLDQFSAVNDKHGRLFSDHILRFVGQVITSRIRKCDIAARKGQRFSLVLVGCTRQGAIFKIREIVQRIAQENFGASTGENIQLTATSGIAVYDGKMSRDELLSRAEFAMKFGKDHGRFCTVVYTKEGGPHDVVDAWPRNGKK